MEEAKALLENGAFKKLSEMLGSGISLNNPTFTFNINVERFTINLASSTKREMEEIKLTETEDIGGNF